LKTSTNRRIVNKVLGDLNTGKSHLIRNLIADKEILQSKTNNPFLTSAKFFIYDKENNSSQVILNIWEFTDTTNVIADDHAYEAALFCIVTFDIRDPATADSVFNKWIQLKESKMSESYLFIVGNFVDRALDRKVEIKDICKACSQKEAVYLEISNTEPTNISLLHQSILQRLNFMISNRELFINETFFNSTESIAFNSNEINETDDFNSNTEANDEIKSSENMQIAKAETNTKEAFNYLSFDNIINRNSIGNIFASALNIEKWEGYEENEVQINSISKTLNELLNELSIKNYEDNNNNNGDSVDDEFVHFIHQNNEVDQIIVDRVEASDGLNEELATSAETEMHELKTAFDIIGLNFPINLETLMDNNTLIMNSKEWNSALIGEDENELNNENMMKKNDETLINVNKNNSNKTNHNSTLNNDKIDHQDKNTLKKNKKRKSNDDKPKQLSNFKKMMIKLPNGKSSELSIDLKANINTQIDLFFLSNSIFDDNDSKKKLLLFIESLKKEYIEQQQQQQQQAKLIENSLNNNDNNSRINNDKNLAKRKCKIRLTLPNNKKEYDQDNCTTIEIKINKNENLLEISNAIASNYNLSEESKNLIYLQLLNANEK
jgi:hypothetical protein